MRKLIRRFRASSSILFTVAAILFFLTPAARPDTVILHNGTSYNGKFDVPVDSPITFTDSQGIQYNFPQRDVQSLVFAEGNDIVTLRSGKVYTGNYTGVSPIPFMDNQGVGYQFPTKDVESLVLTRMRPAPPPAPSGPAKVIPVGTEITIRTDDAINARDSGTGQLYGATISQDVFDASNNVAIPAGSAAKLVVRDIGTGGAVHSADLVLDLFSISINSKEYRVDSSDVNVNNKRGVGANKRTAEFGGGGAAIGALFGGIFGGGKGAGIGAAAGAGSGLLTQIFTRGKQVQVPAETSLMFRLDQTLVLKPH
ncbi:MAG: hypothetical protein JO260_08475 [Acidobacteria bacterium]|nr:hypothetical protein [Acidobacteriota bacterium]